VWQFGWRSRIGPEEAGELVLIDRRLGITGALMSGSRAVLEAIRRAGFVPTAEELGSFNWFLVRSGVGLDAIAELQPDWSQSFQAGESLVSCNDGVARSLARLHHAPGF
jgi:hypothetical protein